MTRRHFEILAAVVQGSGSRFKSQAAHVGFASDLAAWLARENPRFDRARFLEACRPTWVVGTRRESAWDRAIRD
jgi:hypothetical protein